MKWLIIAAASLAVVSCASLSLEDLEFHSWKLKFDKSYRTPEEEAQRKDIWLSTRRRVLAHNILADQGIKTYRMGMNQFSDMDDQEYYHAVGLGQFMLTNKTKSTAQEGVMMTSQAGSAKLPDFVDWRNPGCVTAVKNQGHCGSSWAFSATGALESHTCLKFNHLPSLSEQQLLDCSGPYGNLGCSGGSMIKAYMYIRDAGGIESSLYYPYEAESSLCRFKSDYIAAFCHGIVSLPAGDEVVLQATVALVGPVSAAIDATHDSFRHYLTGVYYEPHCTNLSSLGLLVVGYGTDGGKDYWLLKNSWGETWGNQGYIKLSRNQNNHCGIASHASYPIV